jgi:hypothetical protein
MLYTMSFAADSMNSKRKPNINHNRTLSHAIFERMKLTMLTTISMKFLHNLLRQQ